MVALLQKCKLLDGKSQLIPELADLVYID